MGDGVTIPDTFAWDDNPKTILHAVNGRCSHTTTRRTTRNDNRINAHTGERLYKPSSLNKAFKKEFEKHGWDSNVRVLCDYPTDFYTPEYSSLSVTRHAFREMDFIKNRLGVEVQFGKYAFMVYNVCAKMTIFHNEGFIDAGVEIVPLKELASEMSTGVSYFEQFVWDLEHRGVSNIDIPVLIIGISK